MTYCNCSVIDLYIFKDGGTIFCLNCLHIYTKEKCNGKCKTRCLKCTKTQEELRKLADYLKKNSIPYQ